VSAGLVPATLEDLVRVPPGQRVVLDGREYAHGGTTSPVRLVVDAETHQRRRPLTGELSRSAPDADPLWVEVRPKSVERTVLRSYHVWVRSGGRSQVVSVDHDARRLEVWSYEVPSTDVASDVQGNAKDGFWCWVGFGDVTEVGYVEKPL
jgi:hypothetical protein